MCARPQHGVDREDYEEDNGENNTIMDQLVVQFFGFL